MRQSISVIKIVLLTGIVFSGLQVAATAKDPCSNPLTKKACAEANDGALRIGVSRRESSEPRPAGASSASRQTRDPLQIGAAFCAGASAGASREIAALCRGVVVPVVPGRDQVRRAFRELPLYRGAIRTDPPTLTLVNLETYFWCADTAGRDCTTIGEAEQRITLLGQQVRIKPHILDYTWDFGDGTSQQITNGKAAHEYRHATTTTITLTLTWTADYALGTGPFQPINDTTTTTSPPRLLPIREAQAVIVR